jgi:glycosyltransferase involved in cell wall biosynthesis
MRDGNVPRIGYVPMSATLAAPGDRRRFAAYARARQLPFELARPEERYDLVVLSEKCDISAWCECPHGKIVYDFVDSYLAVPRRNPKQWLRGVVWYAIGRHRRLQFDYWAALQNMCRRADAVVCTTEEQKADIEQYCPNVHVVLDVHDSVVRTVKKDYRSGEPFNLVWEGLATTLPQLLHIRDVLRDTCKRTPLMLNIVTDPDQPRFLGRVGRVQSLDLAQRAFDGVRLHPWEEATVSDIICRSDLAVIPIDLSDPFVTGKPQNKLLLFWRMGMPVVTSATPAYRRTMREAGLESFACSGSAEWCVALDRMMKDESLRREAGERGRAVTERFYNAECLLARWDAVFASIGFPFGTAAARLRDAVIQA